ncbi:ABC transporter related [Beutenbergia cavernae DSM 12333]|uniref:ABC transporter related n=1 Tax=Beutenbergia cavernae (strain ATCC BAA-8 / DSM 12333 / CCUG 43141 / JCM 11478 / NBRC 16432 / NCIMB 13614 / HKI 0122) TaxID=471853 RepID=C5C264_BEUC1|nr:ATP-binding cassette domain-containing protein [Beutenbergia cavernae]ACQ81689.1 ABC transporter related [Beutenbergia cavernae DSM 12333]
MTTAPGGASLLEIRDLDVTFTGPRRSLRTPPTVVRAVDGVSLDVRAGETLALVGESGSGKSTVARCVLGLVRPQAGTIRYDGRELGPVDKRPPELQRAVQMVFQDPGSSLNPRMSVGAIIREAWQVHPAVAPAGDRREALAAVLTDVGLDPGVAERRPSALSGGQRQRVSIARALALRPRLLVCDEAVSALDVSVQAQILRLLIDLQASHDLTVLFITHDLAVVRQIADRVAVMRKGELVELAPAGELFTSPSHPYTKGLLAAAYDLEGVEAPFRETQEQMS